MNELIGFLVVLFIFFFPLIRKLLIRKQQGQKIPAAKSVEPIHEEEEETADNPPFPYPQPHRLVSNNFELPSEIEKRNLRGRLNQKRPLAKKELESRLKKVIQGKKPEHAMVILSELYNRHIEIS